MSTFESTTCNRCGGSGSYSWCARHGSTCYGCSGSGRKLTKRGKAAAEFLRSLLMVPASELKVGDLVELSVVNFGDMSVSGKFKRLRAIEIDSDTETTLRFEGAESWHLSPTTLVRKGFTKADKAPLIERALAYQGMLTKLGEIRANLKETVNG